MLNTIIATCRSYRRFHEDERIDRNILIQWVDTARLIPSSSNAQPLCYAIIDDTDICARVFDCCAWAGALPDWSGPVPGERPCAYIIICRDNERSRTDTLTAWDEGIAAQTIMLQTTEAGFGGCIIASIRKQQLAETVGLDRVRYQPDLVLALGKPAEEVRIEPLPQDGSVAYWRDEAGVHHVPKRDLSDILLL